MDGCIDGSMDRWANGLMDRQNFLFSPYQLMKMKCAVKFKVDTWKDWKEKGFFLFHLFLEKKHL